VFDIKFPSHLMTPGSGDRLRAFSYRALPNAFCRFACAHILVATGSLAGRSARGWRSPQGALTVPILRLARDCRRVRVLYLQPALGAAGAVRRAQALRHDTLTTERASLAVDDRAIRDVKCALNTMPACLPRRSDLRVLLRVSIGSRRPTRKWPC
jgi:hypothetical protein